MARITNRTKTASEPLTLERFERALKLMAYFVVLDGPVLAPLFEKLERECEAMCANQDQSQPGRGNDSSPRPDNEDVASKLRPMLSMKQVLNIVPVSRTTLWRMITDGKFPKSKTLSDGRVAWFEDEVIAWQTALLAA
jgi:prophage regulatory protein